MSEPVTLNFLVSWRYLKKVSKKIASFLLYSNVSYRISFHQLRFIDSIDIKIKVKNLFLYENFVIFIALWWRRIFSSILNFLRDINGSKIKLDYIELSGEVSSFILIWINTMYHIMIAWIKYSSKGICSKFCFRKCVKLAQPDLPHSTMMRLD